MSLEVLARKLAQLGGDVQQRQQLRICRLNCYNPCRQKLGHSLVELVNQRHPLADRK